MREKSTHIHINPNVNRKKYLYKLDVKLESELRFFFFFLTCIMFINKRKIFKKILMENSQQLNLKKLYIIKLMFPK